MQSDSDFMRCKNATTEIISLSRMQNIIFSAETLLWAIRPLFARPFS